MTATLDLTEAERAVRLELARVIERGIAADIGEYAVRAALRPIVEALATLAEDEAARGLPESTRFRVLTDAAEWLRGTAEADFC